MPISLLFATLASISVSGGDFVAGLASRRTSAVIVAFFSESLGLTALALSYFLVPYFWPGSLPLEPLLFGFLAGVCATLNITLLYHGFAVGTMSIVAPLEAVVGISIPVAVGVASGDRITLVGMFGILCAVASPLLLAHHGSPQKNAQRGQKQSILLGLGSGLCLGGVFVFLGKAGSTAGMAPLFMERVATVSLTGLLSLRLKSNQRPQFSTIRLALFGGLLDLVAHALYFISTWHGALSISSVIYSLYPVGTILLGRAVLKERLARLQLAGAICALCGIVLLVYSSYP